MLILFPFLYFLLFQLLSLTLYLMRLHVIFLPGKLLLYFSKIEELWTFLEIFRFFIIDVLFNCKLKLKKGLRFVVNAFKSVIVPYVRFANGVDWKFYPIRYWNSSFLRYGLVIFLGVQICDDPWFPILHVFQPILWGLGLCVYSFRPRRTCQCSDTLSASWWVHRFIFNEMQYMVS